MVLRSLLAGSALAIALAACSGAGEETTEAEASQTPAMTSPVAEDVAADAADAEARDSAAADADAAQEEAAAEDDPAPEAAAKAAPPPPPPPPAPAKVAEASPPAAYNRCAVCHTANKGGEDKLGPNLYGVFGSRAAEGGFSYSTALKDSGLTWDEATLHSWLENPRALVPGNRMSFPGLKDAAKRQEIIDYLKQQR